LGGGRRITRNCVWDQYARRKLTQVKKHGGYKKDVSKRGMA